MNKYKIESLAVHKRTFIVEAADDYDAIMEVFKAVEHGTMKSGDQLPQEIFDMNIPPEAWPVWNWSQNEHTTNTSALSSLSSNSEI